MMVVTPEASEASMIRGDSRCTCVSIAPAVAIRPSPETMAVPVPTTTSTPSIMSGLPARPDAADASVANADRDLADATGRIDDHDVGDHDIARVAHGGGLQQQPVACRLGESGEELVAPLLGVVLDLDDQSGVAEANSIAHRGAMDRGVVVGQDLVGMEVVVGHFTTVVAVLELAVGVPILAHRCAPR